MKRVGLSIFFCLVVACIQPDPVLTGWLCRESVDCGSARRYVCFGKRCRVKCDNDEDCKGEGRCQILEGNTICVAPVSEPIQDSEPSSEPSIPDAKFPDKPLLRDTPKPDTRTKPDTRAKPDTQPTDEPTNSAFEVVAKPGSGNIGIQDVCIELTSSIRLSNERPEIRWFRTSAPLQLYPTLWTLSKGGKSGKLCIASYLTPGKSYRASIKLKDATLTKGVKLDLAYQTSTPFNGTKQLAFGTTSMLFEKVVKPEGLNSLISGISKDDIAPIIFHAGLYSGKSLMIVAVGRARAGSKPHTGQDGVDNKSPIATANRMTQEGRWFSFYTPLLFLRTSSITLMLEDSFVVGLATTDGTSVERATFHGKLDTAPITKQFGVDLCAILKGECFRGAKGRDLVSIAGTLKGTANPIFESIFMTTPVAGTRGVARTTKIELHTSRAPVVPQLSFQWFKCGGLNTSQNPCADQGQHQSLQVKGRSVMSGKIGSFHVDSPLPSNTWIMVEAMVGNSGKVVTSSTFFKTR